jgi:hypothetical protein
MREGQNAEFAVARNGSKEMITAVDNAVRGESLLASSCVPVASPLTFGPQGALLPGD